MKKRVSIIFVLVLIGGLSVMGLFFKNNDVMSRMEKKIGLDLRNNVTIIQEQIVREYGEEHIYAKFLVENDKEKKIQSELDTSFGGVKHIDDATRIPRFQNTCQ